eukprot:4019569-Amphidinium_carterae.1
MVLNAGSAPSTAPNQNATVDDLPPGHLLHHNERRSYLWAFTCKRFRVSVLCARGGRSIRGLRQARWWLVRATCHHPRGLGSESSSI